MLTLVSYLNDAESARRPITTETAGRRLANQVYLACLRNGRQPRFQVVNEDGQPISMGTPRGLRLLWQEPTAA